MTYAIITGAHFFPYAWLYQEIFYAIVAGLVSLGAMFMGLWLDVDQMFLIPAALGIVLLLFGLKLLFDKSKPEPVL